MDANPQPEPRVDAAASRPNPTLWRIYRPLVWILALASVIAWAPLWSAISWPLVAVLVVVANLADLTAVRVRAGMRVSTNHFAIPVALVASGAAAALVVAALCNVGRLLRNRRDWNTFDLAVNVSAASFAGTLWVAMEASVDGSGTGLLGSTAVLLTFAMFRQLLNFGWTLEARSAGIVVPPVSGHIGRLMIACAVMFAPAAEILRTAGTESLVAATLALLLPFVVTQYVVRAFGRERELNVELEAANVSLTESLVNALDARDRYSAGHSVAVAVYARDLAREIGLPSERVDRIYLAGLLHDIGKIAVRDAVLLKPGALTEAEFEEIKKHPVAGEEILRPSAHLQDVLPAVRHHHERMDGTGYPDGLADQQIPLEARILAVADAYNAMTSSRPYRDAMEPELAVRILIQNQGMQHDPFLVAAFQRVLASRHHDYAIAMGPEFATSRQVEQALFGSTLPGDAVDEDAAAA